MILIYELWCVFWYIELATRKTNAISYSNKHRNITVQQYTGHQKKYVIMFVPLNATRFPCPTIFLVLVLEPDALKSSTLNNLFLMKGILMLESVTTRL